MKTKKFNLNLKTAILLGILLTAVRLFFAYTQYATITPPLAPIDDHFMFKAAKNITDGNWLGEYNYLTLSKHAFFALWLAFIHLLGIPYMVGSALLWAFASVVFAAAFAPVIKNNWARLFLYAGLLYNPAVWAQFSTRIYRDSIFPSLCMLFFGCAAGVGIRYKEKVKKYIWFLAGSGISFGCIYLSREDGVWVLPFAFAAVIIIVLLQIREKHPKVLGKIISLLLPFALSLAIIFSYCGLNQKYYGRFIVSDFTSKDFKNAYGALTSIDHKNWNPLVAVPEDVREKLYKEVPAFAPIKEALEEPLLKNGYYNKQLNDFQSGGFYWALRTALQNLGYYQTPQKAQQYYETLYSQIKTAVEEGRLSASKGLKSSVTSPIKPEYVLPVIQEGIKGITTAMLFSQCDPLAEKAVGYPGEIQEVEEYIRQKGGTVLKENSDEIYLSPVRSITHKLMRILNVIYKICIPIMMVITLLWQLKQLLWDIKSKRFTAESMTNIILLGVLGMSILRCFMIAYVEVSAFNIGTYGMYLSTVYPLFIAYAFIGFCKTFEQ